MNLCRWPLSLSALILTAITMPWPAQAQAQAPAAPPPVPKALVAQNFKPGPGRYVSTVDNFDGLVAVANMQGTGKDGQGKTLYWEADLRAIQGVYMNTKGLTQRGTFVFT